MTSMANVILLGGYSRCALAHVVEDCEGDSGAEPNHDEHTRQADCGPEQDSLEAVQLESVSRHNANFPN